MTAYVHRPFYENELQQHKSSTDIKVITGVRRCGKSSLMGNLAEQAQADVGKANVFYRRMDQFGIPLSPTAEWLERELADALSKRNADRMFYVFLDEIQDVSCWEKVVRRLHAQEDIDAYITGSNAHVLSSDLATLLGGRYAQILVIDNRKILEMGIAISNQIREADLLREGYDVACWLSAFLFQEFRDA